MRTVVFDKHDKLRKLSDVLGYILDPRNWEVSGVKNDGSIILRVRSAGILSAEQAFDRVCLKLTDIPHVVTPDKETLRFSIDLTTSVTKRI